MAEDFTYPADRYLLIGKVVKPHGIRGELKIYPYSQQPESIQSYKHLVLVNTNGERSPSLKVTKCRLLGKLAIVAIETVTDRNHAEQLQGMGVLVQVHSLPEAKEDEFYWFQLQGLLVRTEQGRLLGRVKHIFSNGAQDIMVIGDAPHEYMVPILDTIIVKQNDEGIVINPPPGLLEMNSGDDM